MVCWVWHAGVVRWAHAQAREVNATTLPAPSSQTQQPAGGSPMTKRGLSMVIDSRMDLGRRGGGSHGEVSVQGSQAVQGVGGAAGAQGGPAETSQQ